MKKPVTFPIINSIILIYFLYSVMICKTVVWIEKRWKDCQETEYIVLPAVFPISYLDACRPTSYLYKHFEHNLRKHFAFSNYKILVKDGIVPPDMAYGLSNGTFCIDYFQNYVAFVTIDGPSSAAILNYKRYKFGLLSCFINIGRPFWPFCWNECVRNG